LTQDGSSSLSSETLLEKVQEVRLQVGAKVQVVTVDHSVLTGDAIGIPLMDQFSDAKDKELATVTIKWTDGNEAASRYFSIRYRFTAKGNLAPYGIGGGSSTLWIPVGLFGTNFKSSKEGIPFGAFPVGVASGVKVRPGKGTFYLGFSAMANWAIVNEAASTDEEDTETQSGDFTLTSLAAGF